MENRMYVSVMIVLEGPLKALVLDDEKSGRDMVGYFIAENASDLFGEVFFASDIDEATRILERSIVDVVFLDIQLKGEIGFNIAQILPPNTHVVVVSAFPEYALQAIKLEVIDYLLKPISEDDFLKLKQKIEKRIDLTKKSESPGQGNKSSRSCWGLFKDYHPTERTLDFQNIKSFITIFAQPFRPCTPLLPGTG
ncbi:MAG: response regulator [Bacteroidetes bacterium]|nr:response regulator [Bacteroidota bacterium]